ncbi:MAG: D-aminoacyl-tRNA deacylase [Candidatus Delongbacteria bacterium]
MRALLQRVAKAEITCAGGHRAAIGRGLVVLVGVEHSDGPADVLQLLGKLPHLRLFPDAGGVMNLSLLEMNSAAAGRHVTGTPDSPGELLLVSQFTLHADTRRGRRPYYGAAAAPAQAQTLLDQLAAGLLAAGLPVARGVFGEHMDINLLADGPVTLLLDTRVG